MQPLVGWERWFVSAGSVLTPGVEESLDFSTDPVACRPADGPDDNRYWPEVFHDEAGGVL